MTIDLYTTEKAKHTIHHDLNFAKTKYEAKHLITFKNPSAALVELLRDTGSIPGEGVENGQRKKDVEKKRKRTAGTVDMEKLADGLVKLAEDDLLQVVQMIHDNKSDETYTKNDVDRMYPDLGDLTEQLIVMQRASFMSTCTHYLTRLSRCFGTSWSSNKQAHDEHSTRTIGRWKTLASMSLIKITLTIQHLCYFLGVRH